VRRGAAHLAGLGLVAAIACCLALPAQAVPPADGNVPPPAPTRVFSSQEEALAAARAAGPAPTLSSAPLYHTYPEFSTMMTTTVTTPASGAAEGYIFVTGMGLMSRSDPGLHILDNSGEPIYLKRTLAGQMVTDFKRQTVNGVDYLTYYVGTPVTAWAYGAYYVMDESYTVVDTWTIHNGLGADEHGLTLLDNGHALLFSYIPLPTDLSSYGGPQQGHVMDIYIEEQDAAKNVVFSWRASEHIPLLDTYTGLYESPADYVHTNAVVMDTDGNLLVSSRNLSEITKINRQTGEIMWRLGGRKNQFTFTNDSGFWYQHDINRLANGHITLFDNGNRHTPPFSRAVEYEIDETTKTITRTWQFPSDQSVFAPFMGSAQRLDNGNTFIGWGALPHVTEATAAGSKAFEMTLGALSYRAFRFTWDAAPAELPRLVLAPTADPTTATLYAAWNGATDISGYEIYAGPTTGEMELVATVTRGGFETTADLSGLDAATCAFKIRPVHAQERATPFSAVAFRRDRPACLAQLHVFVYFPLQVQ